MPERIEGAPRKGRPFVFPGAGTGLCRVHSVFQENPCVGERRVCEPGEWHLPHRYVPVLCHAHASAFPWQNGQKLLRAGESDICIFGRNGQTSRRAGAAPARGICLRRGGVSRCVGKRACPGISFSQKGRNVPACGKGGEALPDRCSRCRAPRLIVPGQV